MINSIKIIYCGISGASILLSRFFRSIGVLVYDSKPEYYREIKTTFTLIISDNFNGQEIETMRRLECSPVLIMRSWENNTIEEKLEWFSSCFCQIQEMGFGKKKQ